MLTEGTVLLTVIYSESAVAVEATTLVAGTLYSASGMSKCDPIDNFNQNIGSKLAIGRAVRELGRAIYRDGNEAVKTNDRVRAKVQAEQERLLKIKRAKAVAFRKQAEASTLKMKVDNALGLTKRSKTKTLAKSALKK